MSETSADELKTLLQSEVAAHYANSVKPLLLSRLGQLVGVRPQLGTTLAAFVRDNLSEEYELVGDAARPNIVAVVPRAKAGEYKSQLEERAASATALERFPRILLVAFFRPVAEGQRIFFRPSPPYRYEMASEAPSPDYVEIDPALRVAGHSVRDPSQLPPEIRATLAQNVAAWLAQHKIELHRAVRRPNVSAVSLTALQRLINAQPLEIRSRVLIPADIAEILSKY